MAIFGVKWGVATNFVNNLVQYGLVTGGWVQCFPTRRMVLWKCRGWRIGENKFILVNRSSRFKLAGFTNGL